MKLVVGQNIPIENVAVAEVDFAWRSLKSDLNLTIHALAFSNGEPASQTKLDINNIILPDAVEQDATGRHFSIDFAKVPSQVDRIAFYGFLPELSRYSLAQTDAFEIRVNETKVGRIATMAVDAFTETDKSVLLCEFYLRKGVWKLAYKLQAVKSTVKEVLTQLGFSIEQAAVPEQTISSNEQTKDAQDKVEEAMFLDNVELKKGQNLSLGKHFQHCTAITCALTVVPKLDDLALNVIAINRDNKVNNIKDFLYQENKVLRGDGVKVSERDVLINLDLIPEDITKVQLLVTRRSSAKRISSADFIEIALTNTFTGQKIAKYISETNDKNYNTMVLLNLYRGNNGWTIRAVGQGFSQGLDKIGERYHFSPPKLRQNHREPIQQIDINDLHADRSDFIEKYKKMQSLSYWIMGIAALLVVLTFSRVLFLPLACILAGAGWYLFQRASKALRSVEHEKFERVVLKLIKANNYKLTAFEVATTCQVTIENATQVLDELCSKGLGNTAVNREGGIYYDFSTLK
ncbi:TerD family protein [Psychromonas aquatilis]|uniref:TerD family protein n=1 Tax=Psychromonas aquatilis TaxID=2005072 RepID=A0ABU9GTG8_9GAMM